MTLKHVPPAASPPREAQVSGNGARRAVAHIRDDLAAYHGDWGAQGFWAMGVYRFGRWRYGVRPAWLRKIFSALYKVSFKFIQIVTGIELPCEAVVGRHFVIDHHGDIIVSGHARFGDHCRIRSGVCVGLARVDDPCAPTIGHHVDIGTGAKVLGRITIGDNVLIGANAVVLCDVPANSIAVGVPAVHRPRKTAPVAGVPPGPGPSVASPSPLSGWEVAESRVGAEPHAAEPHVAG